MSYHIETPLMLLGITAAITIGGLYFLLAFAVLTDQVGKRNQLLFLVSSGLLAVVLISLSGFTHV